MIHAGIFVGGRGRRMGGVAKGLLRTSEADGETGETIVRRWARLFEEVGVACVLVGAHEAYANCGILQIPDDTRAEGPLAGLLALLAHGAPQVIAVACDMPYVSASLVRRLVAAPPAPVVAARRGERWEPFFARYDAAAVLPVALSRAREGELSLQGLLGASGAVALSLSAEDAEELRDWDAPDDVDRRVD